MCFKLGQHFKINKPLLWKVWTLFRQLPLQWARGWVNPSAPFGGLVDETPLPFKARWSVGLSGAGLKSQMQDTEFKFFTPLGEAQGWAFLPDCGSPGPPEWLGWLTDCGSPFGGWDLSQSLILASVCFVGWCCRWFFCSMCRSPLG